LHEKKCKTAIPKGLMTSLQNDLIPSSIKVKNTEFFSCTAKKTEKGSKMRILK